MQVLFKYTAKEEAMEGGSDDLKHKMHNLLPCSETKTLNRPNTNLKRKKVFYRFSGGCVRQYPTSSRCYHSNTVHDKINHARTAFWSQAI